MNQFWGQLQGQSIDRTYVLERCLRSSEAGAVYETVVHSATPAVIRIYDANAAGAHRLYERWSTAVGLSHENLIRIFHVGQSAIDETQLIYAVMERADETLDTVLAARPLTSDETREMLAPALNALGYLHGLNLVHGAIRPSKVMAAGDTLKLSSDTISGGTIAAETTAGGGDIQTAHEHGPYNAPELADGFYTAASDVWSLGMLLSQALTALLPERRNGMAALPADLEKPLRTIIEHCLDTDPSRRWTVPQISDALNGRVVPNSVPVREAVGSPNSGQTEAQPVRDVPRVQPPPQKAAAAPVPEPVPTSPRLPLPARSAPERFGERTRPRWLVPAGIVIAVLVLLIWAVVRTSGPKQATASAGGGQTAAQPVPYTAPAVAPSPMRAVSKTPPPHAPTPAAESPVRPANAKKRESRKDSQWFVVVATYSTRQSAEHRASEITKRWPAFPAKVFTPPIQNPHFLIVIGSNLSENQAESLRKRSRAAGLPQDLYIKRFAS